MTSATGLSKTTVNAECVARWYAIYTNPRHEKVVAKQLTERGIENFLPLYRAWHEWKDRRKQVELALFPGYVFVRIEIREKLRILQVVGVVNVVSVNGQCAVLPDQEIDVLRNGLENRVYAEPCPYLTVGTKIRVVRGPMAGSNGILSRWKDKCRVVISVDALMRSIAVEIDATDLEIVEP